jgi:hypothetical protein
MSPDPPDPQKVEVDSKTSLKNYVEMESSNKKLESLSTVNAGDNRSAGDPLPQTEKETHDELPGLDESSYSSSGATASGSGATTTADVDRNNNLVEPIMVSVHACGQPRSSIISAIHSQ